MLAPLPRRRPSCPQSRLPTLLSALVAACVAACSADVSYRQHVGSSASGPALEPEATTQPPPEPAPRASSDPRTSSGADVPTEATAEPPPRSAVILRGDSLIMPGNIVFHFGKSTLKDGTGTEAVLEELRLFLVEHPEVTKLRIEGHTDSKGKDEDNLELSGQRALTIKQWLVERGIAPARLLAVGFGESRPIADNDTSSGRAQNRRTEFKLAELDGTPYLGRNDLTAGGTLFDQ